MSEHIGRTVLRYIDEQAEAIIADGGRAERVEMDWPHFDALKRYADTIEDQPALHTHPDVPVVVKQGSAVTVAPASAATPPPGQEDAGQDAEREE